VTPDAARARLARRGWALEYVEPAAWGHRLGGWRATRPGWTRGHTSLAGCVEMCERWGREQGMNITTLHGNCIELLPTLPACSAEGVLTDPPYALIGGGVKTPIHRGGGFAGHARETKGRMFASVPKFDEWAEVLAAPLTPSAEALVMTNDRNLPAMWEALRRHGWKWHNLIVWDKVYQVNNMWYQKQAEFILYLYRGRARRLRNLGASTLCRFAPPRNRTHISEKPVALLEWLISNHDWVTVLDPFMGSGSTGEAAIRQGRGFIGIEIEATDYQAAATRIQAAARRPVAEQTPLEAWADSQEAA
jgi:site-specific DNA-methyltransferase (adenine-specific)